MADRTFAVWCALAVVASALALGICAPGTWSTYAQDAAPPKERAKGSARTVAEMVAEIRGLVADLERLAEQQRLQLRTTEASLRQAQALLKELEGTEAPRTSAQPNTFHSRKEEQNLPDQTAAEKTAWRWPEEQATPQASARRFGSDYDVQVTPTPGDSTGNIITVTRGGRTVYSRHGHSHSVFVRAGDVLYYADFHPHSTGCAIVAFDLKGEKRLWRTQLLALPRVVHSAYWNRINLEVGNKYLTVFGNEAFGRYIELVDRETGKTVGHRVLRGLEGTERQKP